MGDRGRRRRRGRSGRRGPVGGLVAELPVADAARRRDEVLAPVVPVVALGGRDDRVGDPSRSRNCMSSMGESG
jgi:hypothetical protein